MIRSEIMARWVPAVAVMAAIFALSSMRGPDLPAAPIIGTDKLIHAAVYAFLAALLYRATGRPLLAVALAIGYGVTDELHQSMVPGRLADPFDALADAIGAVLGVASTRALRALRDHGDHSKLQGNPPDDR